MRQLFLFSLLLVFANAAAQVEISVTEIEKTFSKGNHIGFSVIIPQAKLKEITSNWKKYLKKNNKLKVSEVSGEIVASRAPIIEISPDSIMVYTVFNERDSSVEMISFVAKNETEYISSSTNPRAGETVRTFIRSFAIDEYRKNVTTEISYEKKKLVTQEEDLKELEEATETSRKNIKANEREIERTESDIKSNKQLREMKSDAIVQQQKILGTFTSSSDRKKEEEKTLKNLEKEKSKIEKEGESMAKKIESLEDKNKTLEKTIENNTTTNIPAKQAEIAKQRERIVAVEDKLRGIK